MIRSGSFIEAILTHASRTAQVFQVQQLSRAELIFLFLSLPAFHAARNALQNELQFLGVYRTAKYGLIRYHGLIFDSVADGAFRSTYLPWIDSITHLRSGEKEEIELRLNSNYENVWRVLRERLDEPAVRLKSQYSSRLYLWAKQYLAGGQKRVSVATLRKILGLEDIKDK